ncbi:LysR family transcriptional regulator [Labrenzia sp. R4_1]|uniref:LysR family transcriptional regulator n=1 Tax=Labrenzia sp. R4_1 TaxID=2821106 RepID=UPI001ADAF9C1|nr:LysR family transcriptional regulator [Labrenzia sp. R4_1]MBO9427766.1 LysR family transcriptional regulator [Labrenzia sp. R4_1]
MSKPLDRLALLETFIRIAEKGSISGAARDLGMSQGSASRQLKDLEERLGVQLARRTTHSLALTETGFALLKDARELVTGWNALEEQYAGDTEILRGPLRIVAPVALGQLHLADIAIGFQASHPEVTVNWHLQDEPIRFAEIGCDLWIKIGPVPDDTLIVRRLGQVERMVVGTPSIAEQVRHARPDETPEIPFVTLTPFEGAKIRLSDPDGDQCDLKVTAKLSTNNIMSLKHAALSGLGAAVLPRWFIAGALGSGELVDLFPEWRAATLDVNLAYLPARHQPRRLTAFVDALEGGLQNIPGMI